MDLLRVTRVDAADIAEDATLRTRNGTGHVPTTNSFSGWRQYCPSVFDDLKAYLIDDLAFVLR